METRIALIGIIVENLDSAEQVNEILHSYSRAIIGRMGIPHRERGVSVISVIVDADSETINTMAGKIGMLPDVSCKTMYTQKQEGK